MGIRPTFFGMEIARTGLMVSQKGLDVTGHNISNVDTVGYTRQRLVNTAREPYNALTQFRPVDNALVGHGARVMILDQIRDIFLDRQFRIEQSLASYWQTRTNGLSYVESFLQEKGDGSMYDGLYDFIGALYIESTEANDREQRVNLKQSGTNFTQSLNMAYDQLMDRQKMENLSVSAVVMEINTIAQNIADLNDSIYRYEIEGQPANDLRDKRNLLIDQLSGLVDIDYGPIGNAAPGAKMVISIGGVELVNHKTVNVIALRQEDNVLGSGDDFEKRFVPYWDTGKFPGMNVNIKGGELLAHIEVRDGLNYDENPGIPYFVEKINTLARAVAQKVNEQHRKGFTHIASGESRDGVNFFADGIDALFDNFNKGEYTALDSIRAIAHSYTTIPPADMTAIDDLIDDVYANPLDMAAQDALYTALRDAGIEDYTFLTAGNFRLSDEVALSEYNIATSSLEMVVDENDPRFNAIDAAGNPLTTHIGNNENMRALIDLFTKQDVSLSLPSGDVSIGNFETYLAGIIVDIAVTLKHAKDVSGARDIQLLNLDTMRTSVSGVSLDEEMTSLIKYQHAYAGASRVITTMDEALDVLINRTGRVGL